MHLSHCPALHPTTGHLPECSPGPCCALVESLIARGSLAAQCHPPSEPRRKRSNIFKGQLFHWMFVVLVHSWGKIKYMSIIMQTIYLLIYFLKKHRLLKSWVRAHLQSNDSFHLYISADVVRPGPFCSVRFILWGKANIRHCLWVLLAVVNLASNSQNINVRQTKLFVYSDKCSFKWHSHQSSNCFFVLTLLAVTVPQSLK